ncbi:MAG: hypothetical protein QOJ22_219 [Thermoleophilaceae bacterium]|nr:hypothetical protein [Thermoleophilaceae bacterium]
MARNPDPIMLSDLVRRAVEIVDPDGHDPAVSEFELRFEDADEPVTGIENLEERVQWGADEDPGVVMAQAIILYLAHRRDEVDDEPGDILELAAKAEWHGHPPKPIADWLAERGIVVA